MKTHIQNTQIVDKHLSMNTIKITLLSKYDALSTRLYRPMNFSTSKYHLLDFSSSNDCKA